MISFMFLCGKWLYVGERFANLRMKERNDAGTDFTGYSQYSGWSDFCLELRPLEPTTSYISFNLPSALLNDSDPNSIWALTFEREDCDEKYVLYLDKTLPKEE